MKVHVERRFADVDADILSYDVSRLFVERPRFS
jgi:hypothetical protein